MNKQIETILTHINQEEVAMEEQVAPARQRVRIGSCVDIRPQQYAHKDPHPYIPFEHGMITPPSKWGVAAYLALLAACYGVLTYLVWR